MTFRADDRFSAHVDSADAAVDAPLVAAEAAGSMALYDGTGRGMATISADGMGRAIRHANSCSREVVNFVAEQMETDAPQR